MRKKLIAFKNKDNNKRAVLEIVINKYMIAGYEAKANGKELSDADLIKIISKTLKELEEEKASYEKANRIDTVNDINAQIEVLSAYLPKLMSEEEIKNVILSLEDKSVPAVMKHFKTNYNGKCDMALVNKVLKSL